MKFQELLDKYKNHTATEEERRMVEEELEKYQAMTDYFLAEDFGAEEMEQTSPDEWKKISRSMKKRNGLIIAAAVVLACMIMGLVFAFQPVISKWIWYDPTEADMQEFAYDMECHLDVLSELTMPEVSIQDMTVKEQGWGVYDIELMQRDFSQGSYEWLSGNINRGSIRLNSNLYDYCAANAFSRGTMPFEPVSEENGVIRTPSQAKAALAEVPEYVRMEAYISLSRDWSMEELAEFQAIYDPEVFDIGWVGVRISPLEEQRYPLMGFDAHSAGYIWDDMDTAYPFYELSMHKDAPKSEAWEKHFFALLQYSIDHRDFYERLMGNTAARHGSLCESAMEYVRENGVMTYGFLYYGTPSEITRILEHPDVEGVYVSDTRLDVPGL